MAKTRSKNIKLSQSNGRAVEKKVYDKIRQTYPRWYVNRYNENKFSPTPCDIELQTKKNDIHIEVKSTVMDVLQKGSVRKNQIGYLLDYHKLNIRNLSFILFYFNKSNTYVIVDIITFMDKVTKSRLDVEYLGNIGYVIKDWKQLANYFARVSMRK